MRQKIRNRLHISIDGADLTGATNPELYVRQGIVGLFRTYVPQILSPNEILVEIPYKDAMELHCGTCSLQLAWTDADGNPRASNPVDVSVGTF